MKYYGVRRGRDGMSGAVFDSWDACKPHVIGVPGAEFKSFSDRSAAEMYAHGLTVEQTVAKAPVSAPRMTAEGNDSVKAGELRIFVDGSFNPRSETCGFAAYIESGSGSRVIYGSLPHSCGGRNIEGEVAGALTALDFLKGYRERSGGVSAVIYHDYEGIGKWADGQWNASKDYTRDYANAVCDARKQGVNVTFRHVDGHTGVIGNEYADVLAKKGCGVPMTAAEQQRFNEVTGKSKTVCKNREAFAKTVQPEMDQFSFDLP